MPLLVGRYVNKIDRKGRVSVPKSFRDALAEESPGFGGIFAYPLFKVPAVEACGEASMKALADRIDGLDMFSDDQDDLASIFLESAHQLSYDPEGRVVLPPDLLDHGVLSGEAMFVGRGGRFAIWNPATFAEHQAQAFARARINGATLPPRRARDGVS